MNDFRDLPPIYFIRHGETDWNKARRLQGRTDIALNEHGYRQARAIAQRLLEIEPDPSGFAFHVSPLTRTMETMAVIADHYRPAVVDAVTVEDLIERSFGVHEGSTWPELNAAGIDPERDAEAYYDWQPEEGESYAQVADRIRSWLAGLRQPAVVVSHGAVSRLLRGVVFELPKSEVPFLRVKQDRFYRIRDGELTWFDARDLLV